MTETLTKREKMKILRALESDAEFRYAVAGYIGLTEILKRLDRLEEGQNKLWEEVRALREGQNKLWEEVRALREGQNKLWETVNRLSVTVERLTITVEEEGIDVVTHRLREELGINIKLERLFIDSVGEVDMFGVSGDLCVVGEATVRLGEGLIEELERKVGLLKVVRPDLLRPKLIKVVYVDYATPNALSKAREKGVWVLKWSGDLTPRVLQEIA
ncbi:MAG: hypothetical protein QXU35_03725 [Zestosphaera sp.]